MPERDFDDRIKMILERREGLIPLINPAIVVRRETVNEFLSMEERAHQDNLETIRTLLNTYGISLHAAYTDLRRHPEQLLIRSYYDLPEPVIEFAICTPNEQNYLYFVVMKPQQIKSNGKKELICANVLFCLASTSTLREQRKALEPKPIYTEFHPEISSIISFYNFPQIYQHWTYLNFDKKGQVSHLLHQPNPSKRITWYDLSDKWGSELIVREFGYGAYSKKLPYCYCSQDQTLRREPVGENTPTMQEEIAEILSKLPMPLENYDILAQL